MCQQILLQIGGHGLTTLVHEMLRSDNKSCCLHGIELSVHCADNETRNLLKTITCRSDTWNDHFSLLQRKTGVALAALSENSAVVNVITRWGFFLDELVHVRNALPSMTDSDLAAAYDAIATGSETDKAKGVFAIAMARCPRGHQGTLRPLAAIPYRPIIGRILRHLNRAADPPPIAEAYVEQACCAWASP